MKSLDVEILIIRTNFQKNDIGWPQQPQTEKVEKSKMIFLDSTKNNDFQNIKIKLNSPYLDDPGVLSSDFPGLRIFVVSMT